MTGSSVEGARGSRMFSPAPGRLPLRLGRPPAFAQPPPLPARGGVVKSFGGSGGGFLNVGTPEMFVVGAVAWAILGPKELFKLAKQAGEFIGQLRSTAFDARAQFQDALEAEYGEELAEAQSTIRGVQDALKPQAPTPSWYRDEDFRATPTAPGGPAGPPIGEEFLPPRERPPPEPLWDDPGPDDALFDDQIAEAESRLALLKAEQSILAVKRKQREANLSRAREAAEGSPEEPVDAQ